VYQRFWSRRWRDGDGGANTSPLTVARREGRKPRRSGVGGCVARRSAFAQFTCYGLHRARLSKISPHITFVAGRAAAEMKLQSCLPIKPSDVQQAQEAATCRVRNSSFTMMLCYAAYG